MNPGSPSVKDYMTPLPHAITPNETVVAARTLMQRHSVCRLLVMKNGRLVGLVSDRDLLLGAQLAAPRKRIAVEEVMTAPPDAPTPSSKTFKVNAPSSTKNAAATQGAAQ